MILFISRSMQMEHSFEKKPTSKQEQIAKMRSGDFINLPDNIDNSIFLADGDINKSKNTGCENINEDDVSGIFKKRIIN